MNKRAFDFAAGTFAEPYAENGFVHVKRGVTPGFVEYSLALAERLMSADADLREWRVSGRKANLSGRFHVSPTQGVFLWVPRRP